MGKREQAFTVVLYLAVVLQEKSTTTNSQVKTP